MKKYPAFLFVLFLSISAVQGCMTDSGKQVKKNNTDSHDGINETFRKTGWITDQKYRAVIFIITDEECKNSSQSEIEEKLKFEAYKNLQKELNPAYNRNAMTRIKALADTTGKLVKADKGCIDGNVYFYDLEKSDLKSDFEKIKNIK